MNDNTAKGLCVVILFVITVAFGWLPIWLHHRRILTSTGSGRRKRVLDILNCLAGGVFLGVCLVHLLAEGREDFEEYKKMVGFNTDFPLYETVVGVGLFLIVLMEKIGFAMISFFKDNQTNRSTSQASGTTHEEAAPAAADTEDTAEAQVALASSARLQTSALSSYQTVQLYPGSTVESSTTYGAVSTSEAAFLLDAADKNPSHSGSLSQKGSGTAVDLFERRSAPSVDPEHQRLTSSMRVGSRPRHNPRGHQSLTCSLERCSAPGGPVTFVAESETLEASLVAETAEREHHHHHHSLAASTSCHPDGISEMSVMRALLLLVALSFHTVFDGLAVGLQETTVQVWGIMVGVGIHKAIMAFCLGLDLAMTSTTTNRPILFMVFFAFIAPLGIAVGMGVTSGHVDILAKLLVSSILQALATGTFMYVTFFEILGQQFAHSHQAGNTFLQDLVKVLSAVVGFAVMAAVKLL